MADRSALTQGVQIGVEATPGTLVPADKRLNSLGIELSPKVDFQRFRPAGQKFPSIITPGKEWASAKLSGVADYSEIVYALASVCNYAVPTQIAATTAYKWVFAPDAHEEDLVKTYSVEVGGSVRAHRAAYLLVTDFGLKFDRSEASIDGTAIAQAIEDGIALTATPTSLAEVPMLPDEFDVFLDSTSAGIGATKLLRALTGEFQIATRFNPLWVINSTEGSFAAHIEVEPKVTLKLLLEADAQGMGLFTTMRAGDSAFIRVAATSPVEAGVGNPYSMKLDMAAKVADLGDFQDQDGVFALEFTFESVYDSGFGKAFEIDVVNALTDL